MELNHLLIMMFPVVFNCCVCFCICICSCTLRRRRRRHYYVLIGAGNYVKMVHNGIEYGDMQLIGECYDILKVRVLIVL